MARKFSLDEETIGKLFMRAGMWTRSMDGLMDRWHWQTLVVGYVIKSWGECVDRCDPAQITADNDCTDRLTFPGVWDGLVRERYIIASDKPRWTGPKREEHWLCASDTKTYVIVRGDVPGGPVKIGKSSNVEKRLGQLQSASSEPLRLLHVLDFDCEGSMHGRLKKYRLRGEWFDGSEAFYADLGRVLSSFKEI
jgi:hypothetical protein